MFPINHSFYFPTVFYAHPQFLFSNAQFLSTNSNLYPFTKIQSESSMTLSSCQQNERSISNQIQNNEICIPINDEGKRKSFMKKKIIGKKTLKSIDPAKQAERLRKKLANRPKTYKTQKKMYMNADLTALGFSEEGKRILRKRPSSNKRVKIPKEKSQNYDGFQSNDVPEFSLSIGQVEPKKQIHNIIAKSEKILQFYDPHAALPKAEFTIQDNKQIELKKLSILSRKVDFTKQSTF